MEESGTPTGRSVGDPDLEHAERRAAFDALAGYIRARGIRDTQARRKVLAVALDLPGHFEAEQVLYLLRERGARVGKATVYRTLPLLVDSGILQEVRFDTKRVHYKFALGRSKQDQLICRRCGRIIEFESADVTALRSRIAAEHRFHVVSHRFQLSGLCHTCATNCPLGPS